MKSEKLYLARLWSKKWIFVAVIIGLVFVSQSAGAAIWFVKASAAPRGDGSIKQPFNSLADVEAASQPYDIILVLPAVMPLDGGIQLKDGQRLWGIGRNLQCLHKGGAAPRITNTSVANNKGDGVVLAKRNHVKNLHIIDTERCGIYGDSADGAKISNNLLTGCNKGAYLLEFNLPIIGTRYGSYGGIHLVGNHSGSLRYKITRNIIHDGDFTGIAILHGGSTTSEVRLQGNTITDLGIAVDNTGNSAIGIVSEDTAVVRSVIRDTFIDNIGTGQSNSDGVAILVGGSSQQDLDLRNHTQLNTNDVGGTSATGMEVLTFGQDNVTDIRVKNSTFADLNADGLQNIYLGQGGDITWRIEKTEIENGASNGFLAWASEGTAMDALDITINNSMFDRLANTGIAFISDGTLESLTAFIQRNDIIANTGMLFFGNGMTSSSIIDAGGGTLSSEGQNRILATSYDAVSDLFVEAEYNWWGSSDGPTVIFGPVDYDPYLTSDPRP